jgi:hypothetical protein
MLLLRGDVDLHLVYAQLIRVGYREVSDDRSLESGSAGSNFIRQSIITKTLPITD